MILGSESHAAMANMSPAVVLEAFVALFDVPVKTRVDSEHVFRSSRLFSFPSAGILLRHTGVSDVCQERKSDLCNDLLVFWSPDNDTSLEILEYCLLKQQASLQVSRSGERVKERGIVLDHHLDR